MKTESWSEFVERIAPLLPGNGSYNLPELNGYFGFPEGTVDVLLWVEHVVPWGRGDHMLMVEWWLNGRCVLSKDSEVHETIRDLLLDCEPSEDDFLHCVPGLVQLVVHLKYQ